MKLRLIEIRDALTDSFWFMPMFMALVAAGMALGTVALDNHLGGDWVRDFGWVWSGGADGARSVLSTVAGSLMTIVSIVFSLTVTTLAQTSSQFGPRVLRNFTSDRIVQFTLGTFIAAFVYSLLVLRTVRSVDESTFVPYVSINIGMLLALLSMAVLIVFIHHISQSIQAENLIADVGHDFERLLPALFPERMGQGEDEVPATEQWEPDWEKACRLASDDSGYLQRVDDDRLMALATEHDLVIRLRNRPGDFIIDGAPLLQAFPASAVDEQLSGQLRACFSLGRHRTPYQDALYPLQQLVEIAAHALSPGINEPYTAVTCLDWIGASLHSIVKRKMPAARRYDDNDNLRVVADPLTFDEAADVSFSSIRMYGASTPDVLSRMLKIIAGMAGELHRASDREALRLHTQLIGADAEQITNEFDRLRVQKQVADTLLALALARDVTEGE